MHKSAIPGGLFLCAIAIASCTRSTPTPPSPDAAARDRAHAIWRQHETAVVRAIAGEIRDDEFMKACLFFQETTGIEVHGDGTHIGWLPTPETAKDLERLRAWFRTEGDRLSVNEQGRVVVKPR